MEIIFDEHKSTVNLYSGYKKASEWDSLPNRDNVERDLELLELIEDDILIDIGCGGGCHSIVAANKCKMVYSVDISEEMIHIIESKIKQKKIYNIKTTLNGFLTFNYSQKNITKAFSWGALHHLPDVWKGEALRKLSYALPKGGYFLLMDLVYSFPINQMEKFQKLYIKEVKELHGEDISQDLVAAFKTEFITYDWILEGLFKKNGFKIKKNFSIPNKCWSNYLCIKE